MVCAVILLLMFGACVWMMVDPSPESQQRASDSSVGAVVTVCENPMTNRLKAAGSADYPFGHVSNVESLGGDTYRLRSYVDAQNAFGAKLRTRFSCTVEGRGSEISGY